MPFKTWVVGEEVLAADFNNYIQEQVVATFATSAARATAIGSPVEGQMSYLLDTNSLETYDGAAWLHVPTAAELAALQTQVNSLGTGYVSGSEFTPMQTVPYSASTGVIIVAGSTFVLPTAGRVYSIHVTASIVTDTWVEPIEKATLGIVTPSSVGTIIDYAEGCAAGGDTVGGLNPFHLCHAVTAASNNQPGHVVAGVVQTSAIVRNGRVWVEDIGT